MPTFRKFPAVNLPPRAVQALSAGLLLLVLLICATATWPDQAAFLPPGGRTRAATLLIFSAVAGLVAAMLRRRPALPRATPFETTAAALCLCLVLCLLSSAAAHPMFFLGSWFTRGRIGIPRSLLCALLTAGGTLVLLRRQLNARGAARLLAVLLVALQAAAFATLLIHAGGAPLYRDDHPSFMFRIREFVATYPAMTSFNPWWNAGAVGAVGASSGIGAIALPFLPLWRLLPVHLAYTPLVGLFLIVIAPLLTLVGLRAIRASWTAALAGAILALGATRATFVWGLHFGTVGAVAAMSFLPLFSLLLYRAFVMRRADAPTCIGLLLSAFLLVQWPPCLIMAAALLPGCLLNIRRLRGRVLARLLALLPLLALLFLPNILALLANRDLLRFVADNSSAPRALPPLAAWGGALFNILSLHLPEAHPLVSFLGLAGLCALSKRRLRRLLLPAIAILFLVAAWGPFFIPKLQLERMTLPALLLATSPAALFAGRILATPSPRLAVPRALVLSLLLLGGTTIVTLYAGGGYAPYTVLPRETRDFAAAVRHNVPPDGRLLFYGKTVHSFGGGHVAYLPVVTGREMMACDYYHFPPKMVEYDYPPRPWRKTAEGIADFMRLHGATHLATTIPHRAAFIRESGLFTEIPVASDKKSDIYHISLFALKDATCGRVFSGDATVEADFGYLRVTPGREREAVVRYAWNPHITAGDTADIAPEEVAPGVTFIRVAFHGDEPAVIRYGRQTP